MPVNLVLLDNDPLFLKVLKLGLEEEFKLLATSDTNEFLKLIEQPAVLIVDCYLDNVWGMDVVNKVREKNKLVHAIYISSQTNVDLLLRIVNAGWGSYFLPKDRSDFFTELKAYIHKAKALLSQKIEAAHTQATKDEQLEEKIHKTLKALEGIKSHV